MAELELPYTVHDLEFLQILGEGGFGRVFSVKLKPAAAAGNNTAAYINSPKLITDDIHDQHQQDGHQIEFACKVFDAGAKKASDLKDIMQEIRIMHSLLKAASKTSNRSMPRGLVRIRGFHLGLTSQDPFSFIAMDLCKGRSLSHVLKQRTRLSEEDAALVLGVMARALLFCHTEARILHRDIKPANILLAKPGRLDTVCLADFGLSVQLEDHADIFYGPRGAGTRTFMAPEAQEYGRYSPASDVWSLGCVLFRMLCGTNPERPKGSEEVQFEKAGVAWTALSSGARSLVQGMLCPNPHLRLTLQQVLQQYPWALLPDPSAPKNASISTGPRNIWSTPLQKLAVW